MTESYSDTPPLSRTEVLISLDSAVALVLLDLLGRLDDPNVEPLTEFLEHPAERASLWTLRSALEVAVGEALTENYDKHLDEARDAVVAHLEGK